MKISEACAENGCDIMQRARDLGIASRIAARAGNALCGREIECAGKPNGSRCSVEPIARSVLRGVVGGAEEMQARTEMPTVAAVEV